MKKKVIKKINKKATELLIEWLRNLVTVEEQDKINKQTYKALLPKDEYISFQRTYYLSFYTQRWAKQNIKKLFKKGLEIESITIGDLEWMIKKRNLNHPSNIL